MTSTRRAFVTGIAGAAGVAATGLAAACSGGGGDGTSTSTGQPTTSVTGPTTLAKTADIPVGGGKIFANQEVVVTQPTAGNFKGFSAVCTHQHCTVGTVADGTITCPCHGSQYSITDGSVKQGPATQALPAKNVAVSGDSIVLEP
ncbi:MAG: Rieske (2Fe-2S) protein [Hamadaea sp.]|uniref:Rieske (2Fe-2S) protein n=1 Tax=Hamadaea sp. TaxID=2024425 RepID=UPI00185D64A8|nr:Rieske (2Fe-2S) protein [Hamadaea sp.]NUR73505.1 Rieske (2Fe-2S) protein [Hamadaea sp.]NUT21674.1 Rieske (2Fe-2S) protein [Hamadaea sp.]